MLRFAAKVNSRGGPSLLLAQRRLITLQSEKPHDTLAEKIVRGPLKTVFYRHPSYVMAREKMLYTVWVDIGVFASCAYFMIPFFVVAYFFKA